MNKSRNTNNQIHSPEKSETNQLITVLCSRIRQTFKKENRSRNAQLIHKKNLHCKATFLQQSQCSAKQMEAVPDICSTGIKVSSQKCLVKDGFSSLELQQEAYWKVLQAKALPLCRYSIYIYRALMMTVSSCFLSMWWFHFCFKKPTPFLDLSFYNSSFARGTLFKLNVL